MAKPGLYYEEKKSALNKMLAYFSCLAKEVRPILLQALYVSIPLQHVVSFTNYVQIYILCYAELESFWQGSSSAPPSLSCTPSYGCSFATSSSGTAQACLAWSFAG